MDGSSSKVSFIPKGSLIREESFLERRRPRSVLGFIAASAFLLSVSAYVVLYIYNNSLTQVIVDKTTEIRKLQKEFSDAPEVGEAKVFRARTDLARELLDAHMVVSPVFAFLSKNTVGSILYDKFSFKLAPEGPTLELSGEAPSYSSLAYQTDVFKKLTRELSSFSVKDITLTKFGSVTFTFAIVFNPNYLSYVKNASGVNASVSKIDKVSAGALPPTSSNTSFPATSTIISKAAGSPTASTSLGAQPMSTSSISVNIPAKEAPLVATNGTATTGEISKVAEKQSFLQFLWLKFKFW